MTEPLDVALRVARALEAVGVAYHLGGSLASSIYGEPRATNDIDVVVDLPSDRVDALAVAKLLVKARAEADRDDDSTAA